MVTFVFHSAHTFHVHMCGQPIIRCGPTKTHHLSACCGLRTGKHAQDSSTAPRQTGTCTLRCQAERPRPHWWCRSDRPVPGERAVSFPGSKSCRIRERGGRTQTASRKRPSWGLGTLLSRRGLAHPHKALGSTDKALGSTAGNTNTTKIKCCVLE